MSTYFDERSVLKPRTAQTAQVTMNGNDRPHSQSTGMVLFTKDFVQNIYLHDWIIIIKYTEVVWSDHVAPV